MKFNGINIYFYFKIADHIIDELCDEHEDLKADTFPIYPFSFYVSVIDKKDKETLHQLLPVMYINCNYYILDPYFQSVVKI